jgi:hypothetical protein
MNEWTDNFFVAGRLLVYIYQKDASVNGTLENDGKAVRNFGTLSN